MNKLFTYLVLLCLCLNLYKCGLAGGWATTSVGNCEQALIGFYGQSKFTDMNLNIKSCKSQVVAGQNFESTLDFNGSTCTMVIYRDLSNNYQLLDHLNNCKTQLDAIASDV